MSVEVEFIGWISPNLALSSTSTPVGARLLQSFPFPNLEEWRRRTLEYVSNSSDSIAKVQTLCAIAVSTDLKAIFINILGESLGVLTQLPVDKRRSSDICADLRILKRSERLVLEELKQLGVPTQYLELLSVRYTANTFNDKLSSICSTVLLAALLLL
jgi:hypothetical protein